MLSVRAMSEACSCRSFKRAVRIGFRKVCPDCLKPRPPASVRCRTIFIKGCDDCDDRECSDNQRVGPRERKLRLLRANIKLHGGGVRGLRRYLAVMQWVESRGPKPRWWDEPTK